MLNLLVDEPGLRQCPASPKKPCDETYEPPPHRDKILGVINKHERDNNIIFYEKPHKYAVKKDVMSCSVTTLASSHRTPFEANITVHRMTQSKKEAWPRLKYVINAKEVQANDSLDDLFALLYDKDSEKTCSTVAIN